MRKWQTKKKTKLEKKKIMNVAGAFHDDTINLLSLYPSWVIFISFIVKRNMIQNATSV